ncbi:ATP-binding protein, partial [Poseidonibacter sp.]|uniref:ATP-binding protein n=1 Tax=Poseidonibacter sp. TaxID=2321188 RepID=UPI003C737E11
IIRHPDMPKNAFKEMWDTIKNRKEWTGEVKNLKKDGGFYWVIAHISPKYDKNNILVGYSGVRENITDKKALDQLNKNLTIKIQEEIEKNRENALQLYEQEKMIQMTEMIGNIAHHWRQPLSVISTATSGMQLQKKYQILSDEFFEEATENILKQTDNLSKTIEQFTNYINLKDINTFFYLEKHIVETLDIVNLSFKSFEIEMITDIKQSNMKIYSNKTLISQVLLNILYNSRDILTTRKVLNPKVYICFEKLDDDFIITIEDNGGGVKEEDLKKVFEPYFTTKHKSVGTGLGLNICYSIVTLKLKGKIFVKNSSKGALFRIILPMTL